MQTARPALEPVRKVGFAVEAQHVAHGVGPPDRCFRVQRATVAGRGFPQTRIGHRCHHLAARTRMITCLARFVQLGLRGREIAFQLPNLLFRVVQTLSQAIQRSRQRTQQRTLSCATTGWRCVAVATRCVVCNLLDFLMQVRPEKAVQHVFIPPLCVRLWRTCSKAIGTPCGFVVSGHYDGILEAFLHAAGTMIARRNSGFWGATCCAAAEGADASWSPPPSGSAVAQFGGLAPEHAMGEEGVTQYGRYREGAAGKDEVEGSR